MGNKYYKQARLVSNGLLDAQHCRSDNIILLLLALAPSYTIYPGKNIKKV